MSSEVGTECPPRPVPGRGDTTTLEQHDGATPIRPVGLEQLEHPLVGSPRLPRQCPSDRVGKVIVTDRDRVTITVGDPHHDPCRPRTDAANSKETLLGLRSVEAHDLFEPTDSPGRLDEHICPLALHTVTVQILIGHRTNLHRVRRKTEVRPRPRCRLTDAAQDAPIGTLRLLAGNDLPQDRRQENGPDRSRRSEVQAEVSPMEIVHDAGRWRERLWIIIEAEETGHRLEEATTAWTPGFGFQHRAAGGHMNGPRALARLHGRPTVVDAHDLGGVQAAEAPPEVVRTREIQRERFHERQASLPTQERAAGLRSTGMSDRSESSDDLLDEAREWLQPTGAPGPVRPDTDRPETARPETMRPDTSSSEPLESTQPRRTRQARDWAPADPFGTSVGDTSASVSTPTGAPMGPAPPSPYPTSPPTDESPHSTTVPSPPVPPTHQGGGGGSGRFARFVIRLTIVLVIAGGFAIYRAATRTETAPVDTLTIGTCFQDPGIGIVGTIEPVDCKEGHDLEVFAIVQLPFGAGTARPAEDELFDRAYDECLPPFARYTGEQYVDSAYYIDALVPDLHTWKAGDREAVCFLFLIDANSEIVPATGSARP